MAVTTVKRLSGLELKSRDIFSIQQVAWSDLKLDPFRATIMLGTLLG